MVRHCLARTAKGKLMDEKTYLTAAHWGVYRADVQDGVVTSLQDFEHDPDPSPIGHGIVESLNAPSRITSPMVRESWLNNGPGSNNHLRAKEAFVEVSWETVEKLVATEIQRVVGDHGSQAIYAGSYGWASAGRFHHAQSQLKRFLNCTGGFTSSVFSYSYAAAEAIVPYVLGSYREFLDTTTSWRSIAEAGELVVAFGGMPLKNGQVDSGGLGEHSQRRGMQSARHAGVQFVNVSPLKNDMMDELQAQWCAIRPNSDVALMLGLAHTLYSEKLHDIEFLQTYCTGFEKFADYLTGSSDGQAKDADWASSITDISATSIRLLARKMACSRTMISTSWSLTRQHHGEQPFWMAITLASMLGQIGQPGAGFAFGYSTSNSIGADYQLLSGGSIPPGNNPTGSFIPVARITDMLMNPNGKYTFNGEERRYPDIRLVWWAGGNPYHHHQDLNRFAKAWQKPETIIINDWCWNAAAKRADIVLPCTTHLERDDICLSQRDSYMIRMEKAVDAPAQARNDYDIFRGIARCMNIEPDFSEGREDADWIRWIYGRTTRSAGKTSDLVTSQSLDHASDTGELEIPDWQQFCDKGWHRFKVPQEPRVMLSDYVQDPVNNSLATPSGKIEIFSQTVSGYNHEDCPGHPVWQEPYEWLGNASPQELHLISNQPANKLHSQLDQGSVSRNAKIHDREVVLLNPEDAVTNGISDQDPIRLYNKRGACLAIAVLSDNIRQGVVQISTGAWWDPDESGMCKHGNPNSLTADIGTSSLAQGPTAHTCLVRIEKYLGELPTVQAFVAPRIKST